jgi:hypothetical protein
MRQLKAKSLILNAAINWTHEFDPGIAKKEFWCLISIKVEI